jgi:threonine dehydratase
MPPPLQLADVEAARDRLRGAIHATPCPYSQTLSELTGHGLAVAFHAARLGIPAVIVMPEGAPLIKVTSTPATSRPGAGSSSSTPSTTRA